MTSAAIKQAARRARDLRRLILSNIAPAIDHEAFTRADMVEAHIRTMIAARRTFYSEHTAPADQKRLFRWEDVRAAVKARKLKTWCEAEGGPDT